MKRLLAIFLMLLVLIIILATPVLAAGPSLHKATGGGTAILTLYGSEDTFRSTYTFTVQQLDETGHAKGNLVVIFAHGTLNHKHEADIKYAYFESDAVYMSGVIIRTYRPEWIGMTLSFAAQDNGEGNQATGLDKVSHTVIGGPIDVAVDSEFRDRLFGYPLGGITLTNGNVQIK